TDDADLFAISRLISPRASPPTATTERRLSGLDLFSSPDPPLPLLVSTSPTGVPVPLSTKLFSQPVSNEAALHSTSPERMPPTGSLLHETPSV
ncbi:unnamed protein product, partial [Protopolystoma xenopodis]